MYFDRCAESPKPPWYSRVYRGLRRSFFQRIHVAFSSRIKLTWKKHVRLGTRGHTITPTHIPLEKSHSYEKEIGLFRCCLLNKNSGLNTAVQIKHILTWRRNSQVWWSAGGTVGECYSGRYECGYNTDNTQKYLKLLD